MNTIEILNEMKDVNCFIGVFPINKVGELKIIDRPIGLIINLDYSDEPGSHWVALFINEKNEATYFDSYGFPNFNYYLMKFLKINKVKDLMFNKYQIQSPYSKTCGAFCTLFIKFYCNGFNFRDFIKLFSNNKEQNDLISILSLENI